VTDEEYKPFTWKHVLFIVVLGLVGGALAGWFLAEGIY
jgi:hypothetical protein